MRIINTLDSTDRPRTALVVSLRVGDNGQTQLVFDDVSRQTMLDASGWTHERFYTAIDLDSSALQNITLTRDELVHIAETLLIRLNTTHSQGIPYQGYDEGYGK